MTKASGTAAVRIILVRHGETAWNLARRLQGHLDIALNEQGRRQARQTARALCQEAFSACFCSDLERASETARIILAARQKALQPTMLAALRERHYGIFQGLTHHQARARYPQEYAFFARREMNAQAPQGECLAAFQQRIEDFLQFLTRHHGGEQVLVVTHGGVLRVIHALANKFVGQEQAAVLIPNSAINRVCYHDNQLRIESWAQVDHLDAPARDELPEADVRQP